VIEFGEVLADKRFNTVMIGPGAGVGQRTVEFRHTALGVGRHLVLDGGCADEFCTGAGPAV